MYVYPVYSFSDEKCKKIQCKKTNSKCTKFTIKI